MDSSATPAPQLGRTFNDGTLGLVALAILLASAVVWSSHGVNAEKTDFALTYVGAHIVHEGMGRRLYDVGLQVRLRDSMFQHASPLYFEHPPFEALALAPLAGFSFRTAYMVWGLINVAVLLGLIVWLRPYFRWPSEDLGYLFLWLLFAPVGVSLYQGQSSILVLAAYAITFVQLKNGNPLSAGVALGLALLKFQFALPLAVIFLLRRQWRFGGGFAASAAVLGLASVVVVGWGGMVDYLRLLLRIGNNPQNVSYGSAVDMPTLHGLVYAVAGRHLNVAGLNTVVSLLTLTLLVWIAWQWRSEPQTTSFDLMFAAAIAASLLAGSHMFTHDFSPLVVGMFLAANLRAQSHGIRAAIVLTLALFWAFPIYFLLVNWHCLYLMAIVLITFIWACVGAAKNIAHSSVADGHAVAAG
jgi:hypothetical protein